MDRKTDSDKPNPFHDHCSDNDDPTQEPDWILGLNCMIRRSIIEHDESLDEQTGHADSPQNKQWQ